jgi:hypothetical protein
MREKSPRRRLALLHVLICATVLIGLLGFLVPPATGQEPADEPTPTSTAEPTAPEPTLTPTPEPPTPTPVPPTQTSEPAPTAEPSSSTPTTAPVEQSTPTPEPTQTSTLTPTPTPTPAVWQTFSDDFEDGDLHQWERVDGMVVQTDQVLDGNFAARATSDGTHPAFALTTLSLPQNELYLRVRFTVVSRGDNPVYLFRLRDVDNKSIVGAYVASDGYLTLRNDVADERTASKAKIEDGAWYELRLHVRIDPNGGPGETEVWLNGALIDELSEVTPLGSSAMAQFELGENSRDRVFDVAFDGVLVDVVPIPADPRFQTTPTPTATESASTETPSATESPTATRTVSPSPSGERPTPSAGGASPYHIRGSGRTGNSVSSATIYDGDRSTVWMTNVDAPPRSAYVFVNLGDVKPIGKIRWIFGKTGLADEMSIEYSNDRKTWTRLAQPNNAPAGVWQELDVQIEAKYVRWYFRNPNGDPQVGGISEVELLAPDATSSSPTSAAITAAEAPSGFTTIGWSTVASAPIGRLEGCGTFASGKLYVFGGYIDSTYTPTRRADVYDPATDTWTRIADLPVGLTHIGVATDGSNIYLAGGYPEKSGGGQTFSTTAVWAYNIGTNTYSAMPSLPSARGGGALVLLGTTLHYFGGSDSARSDSGSHWTLSLSGGTGWVAAASLPTPRNHLGGAAIGGKVYAVGGQSGQDAAAIYRSDVHAYDPSTDAWTAVASLPAGRSHMSASTFAMDGRIIVLGGETAYQV